MRTPGFGHEADLTTGVSVATVSSVAVGLIGRVGRTLVAVAVGVIVGGGGVIVKVGAGSGPVVTVTVGVSNGRFRVGRPNWVSAKTAAMMAKKMAISVTLWP
jgi:hypothetical protein